MEIEKDLNERSIVQRADLFAGAARFAVGLGCALPLPRPGLELLSASNEESLIRPINEEHEWFPPGPTQYESWEDFAPPGFIIPNQLSRRDWLFAPPGVRTIDFRASDVDDGDTSPVLRHLDSLVSNLSMRDSWREEGVEPPTEDCKIYARSILRRLFERYGLIPYKTSISKDGGLFAAYKSANGMNVLRVEIDNELDAVAVVTDGSSILSSGLLEGDDDEGSIITSLGTNVA